MGGLDGGPEGQVNFNPNKSGVGGGNKVSTLLKGGKECLSLGGQNVQDFSILK